MSVRSRAPLLEDAAGAPIIDPRDDPETTRADGGAEPELISPTPAEGLPPADPAPTVGAKVRYDPADDRDRGDPPDGTGETAEFAHPIGPSGDFTEAGSPLPGPGQPKRPPRFLGEYEILEELARGGMGIVYRARQVKLDRIVALKLVRDPSLASYADLRRFQIEAEAVAQLDHPHIVPIYEVGQADDLPYFSMRLIEGGNLSGNIERLRHHPRDVARLMVKVARAVHYAHQRAILHRDLKPSNILIGVHDEPYVTDFGLAKRIDRGGASAGTASEAVMGTPAYMPPEQARGDTKSVTTAADVYSLGATLFEALTGRPPFAGGSIPEILRRVLDQEPPRPRSLNPKVDRDLETICLKCLEKEPTRRFGSAELLAEDLERWLDGRPITARPVSKRERAVKWIRRRPALAGLIAFSTAALLGLIGMGLYYNRNLERTLDGANRALYSADMNLARRAWDDREIYRVREYLERYREPGAGLSSYRSFEWYYLWKLCNPTPLALVGHVGHVLSVAYSPDGRRLASGGADGTIRLWDPERGRTEHVLTGHAGGVVALSFRPDGRLLASGSADGTVRVWDPANGQDPRILRAGGKVNCIAFSPDGRTIALTTDIEDVVSVWDVDSGEKFSLSSAVGGLELPSYGHWNLVAFGRDGSRLYMTDNSGQGVTVWDVPARRLHARLPILEVTRGLCLTSDGLKLIAFSGTQSISVWDTATSTRLDGLTTGWYGAIEGNSQVACGGNSRGEYLAFGSGKRGSIDLWNLDTRRRIDSIMLKFSPLSQQSLAFSPDGLRLAVALDNRVEIATVVTLESSQNLVSQPGAGINALAVRAGGARLAWAANGDPRIVISAPNLGKPIRYLSGHEIGILALAYGPATRPDLLASAGADGKVLLWDADGGGPPRPVLSGHSGEVRDVAFLPGGRDLISAGSDGTLRVCDVDTGRLTRVLDGREGPLLALAAATDGRRVAAASGNGSILFWDVRTGRTVLGPLSLHGIANDVAISADGTRIAAAGSRAGSGGVVAVWDAASGSVVSRWDIPGVVRSIVFSADGRRVITGGDGGALVAWDVVTGRETIALEGHGKSIFALVGGSDLRTYSAGLDGTIKLWEGLDPGPSRPRPRPRDWGEVYRLPSTR